MTKPTRNTNVHSRFQYLYKKSETYQTTQVSGIKTDRRFKKDEAVCGVAMNWPVQPRLWAEPRQANGTVDGSVSLWWTETVWTSRNPHAAVTTRGYSRSSGSLSVRLPTPAGHMVQPTLYPTSLYQYYLTCNTDINQASICKWAPLANHRCPCDPIKNIFYAHLKAGTIYIYHKHDSISCRILTVHTMGVLGVSQRPSDSHRPVGLYSCCWNKSQFNSPDYRKPEF